MSEENETALKDLLSVVPGIASLASQSHNCACVNTGAKLAGGGGQEILS